MKDRSRFEAEDFLIDVTFQSYCAGTDKISIDYWKKYIKTHPDQQATIAEAEKLYLILSGNKNRLNLQLTNYKQNFNNGRVARLVKLNTWLKVAAVMVIGFGTGLYYYNSHIQKLSTTSSLVAKLYTTKPGERRRIALPDGTIVILNAKSSITLAADYNLNNRKIELNGEAYFDVKHLVHKPFKVHTNDFDINVLGTAFNVKAYSDESYSETTLIRGLITMQPANGTGIITLKPSQKVTFYKGEVSISPKKVLSKQNIHPEIAIDHYKIINDSTVLEIAWTKNRIEIADQDFDQIKEVLEKWYNVKIKFKNPAVEKYRFTATFSKETIEQVLEALKQVENFSYEIKGNEITISK